VHGIFRLLPGRQVARRVPAIGRSDCQIVIIVDVAGGAGHIGVTIGQREPCGAVVKYRRTPTDG
jgi:hypothetical protein